MNRTGVSIGFLFLFIFSCFTQSLATADEPEAFKKSVLQKLKSWQLPKKLGYPRLYFDSRSIKLLSKKYKNGDPRFSPIISECDSLIARPVPDYSNFNESRYVARSESEKLSFAFAVTGKKEYADYAKKLIFQMTRWPSWVYDEHKPRRVDLGVSGVAFILAECYDWLYPTISKNERNQIKDAIIHKALVPFHEVYSTKSESWTQAEHNWRSVICGEMGVAILALLEQVPDAKVNLAFAIEGVVDVLAKGGKDGGWNEGVSYWGYGIGQAIMFVDAMYRVSGGKINLYNISFLKQTGDFGLYCRTPEGNCFNFSDCNPGPPKPWLMALLASHFENPYWQWSAQKEIGNTISDILFHNPELPAKKPKDIPLAKHFSGIKVATMRSSWEDTAIFVGLKTGKTLVNHSHLDLNSFVLDAFGERLLVDQYNWPYAHYLGYFDEASQRWDFEGNHTIAHNTLLVDGQGQGYGESFQGQIVKFSPDLLLQYAVGEANAAYGDLLEKFYRYIALVDGNFVILVDDVSSSSIHQLEWLLHYDGKLSENKEGIFTLSQNDVRLDINFLRPSKADNRVVSYESHETTYIATREATTQTNRFASLRPLHKQQQYRFVSVLVPYKQSDQILYSAKIIKESENSLVVHVNYQNTEYQILFNFNSFTIQIL